MKQKESRVTKKFITSMVVYVIMLVTTFSMVNGLIQEFLVAGLVVSTAWFVVNIYEREAQRSYS